MKLNSFCWDSRCHEVRHQSDLLGQIASHVSPFAQRRETICITYHDSILLICFVIHYWDVFYQLPGSSWLCPSLCSLAESSISLEQISQGERCVSLSILISLKYYCFQQTLRKSRKKAKSEYLLDEELFKNICSLLYLNLVSMKKIVFVWQGAQCVVQEWSVLWLTLTGWSGKCDLLCPTHGELHGSALHYVLGVLQAPFPDSTPHLALEYPSWCTRKLHTKFLTVFQIPLHLIGNNSSNT